MSDAGMHTVQTSSDDDFLPEFPGEDAYKHAGTQWKEDAEALLGKRGLLAVAYGSPMAILLRRALRSSTTPLSGLEGLQGL